MQSRTTKMILAAMLVTTASALSTRGSALAQVRVDVRATAHLPAPPMPPSPTVTVHVRPPAPYQEVVGLAPAPGYVWVDGYWAWQGGQHVWVRGRWMAPPHPGHVWIRSGWTLRGGQYVFMPGRWAAPSVRVRHRFVHPHRRVRVKRGAHYSFVGRRGHPVHRHHPGRGNARVRARGGRHHVKVKTRGRSRGRHRRGR